LQQAADAEHARLRELTDDEERRQQRLRWFEAAATVQDAVTAFARTKRLNRHEVEQELRRVVRRST
jgi:predicted GIY-YIG superfamily endonuclease